MTSNSANIDSATTQIGAVLTAADVITLSVFHPDAIDGAAGGPSYVVVENADSNPLTPAEARQFAHALLAAADQPNQ